MAQNQFAHGAAYVSINQLLLHAFEPECYTEKQLITKINKTRHSQSDAQLHSLKSAHNPYTWTSFHHLLKATSQICSFVGHGLP
jgi:hypothetical protein